MCLEDVILIGQLAIYAVVIGLPLFLITNYLGKKYKDKKKREELLK